jgi:elongation factor P
MYQTNDIRKGLKVEFDGEPYICTDFQFVKPGKGNAFTRTRFKSMITGRVIDKTLKSGETLTPANLEEREMQYLYSDGESYTFMDNENYDQVALPADLLGDTVNWLSENLDVNVLFHNERPVNIDLPNFVEIEITHCEPGVKGDTATGATKPATLATGAIVNVPLFVNEDEVIKIDTRTGDYVSRVRK